MEKRCRNCKNSLTNPENYGVVCVLPCKFQESWEQGPQGFQNPTTSSQDDGTIRKFETGATRDTSVHKLDYEAFLSPIVLKRYAEYLDSHRLQADGTLRDGDNWQKGIPQDVYMKSLIRHVMDTWLVHRGNPRQAVCEDLETDLCAVIFNAMGMLFEVLNGKDSTHADSDN